MIGFEDLDDAMDGATASEPLDIRKAAHIANGGESTFPCPACKGSGVFRSHTGRVVGNCFKCKGTKVVSRGVAAHAKGKQTKQTNAADWRAANADLVAGMRANTWNRFVVSILAELDNDDRVPNEKAIGIVRNILAEQAARNEVRREKNNAEKAAKSGSVTLDAVHALFSKATASGLKRPIFRGEKLTVKMAKRHEGVLYVTDNATGAYCGKIAAGQFNATREAPADTLPQLRMICDNPEAALYAYSRSTATYDGEGKIISCGCGVCGQELTDPESIARGIGPICADNWGL